MKILLKFPSPIGWMYCADNEVEELLKKGWMRSDEEERQKYIEAKHGKHAPDQDEENIEQLREQYSAKFGKAPHHKKSAATLQSELAE